MYMQERESFDDISVSASHGAQREEKKGCCKSKERKEIA